MLARVIKTFEAWRERPSAREEASAQRWAIYHANEAVWWVRGVGAGQAPEEDYFIQNVEQAFARLNPRHPLALELVFRQTVLSKPDKRRLGEAPYREADMSALPGGLAEAIARGARSQGLDAVEELWMRSEEWRRERAHGPALTQIRKALEAARPMAEAVEIESELPLGAERKRSPRI